jgi:exonuclease SbcC
MLLRALTIENIQSYTHETVDFEDGETLIYGSNGAGKSTIFRSVFGALFPESGKHEIGTDFNLADFVRRDADEGRIELTFEAGGQDYTVEWVIDADGNTDACELRSDALAEPISGVRAVERTISTDLLGMDASSFVSSVYVQQGDIARLVHADEDTRKEILDGLLGLSRVDDLIDRAVKARREAKNHRDEAKNRLAEARDQLDDLPAKDTLQTEIAELDERIDQKSTEIEEYEQDIEEIDDQLDEWREQLKSVDELKDRREDLADELNGKRAEYESHGEDLEEAKKNKEAAEEQQTEARERISELDEAVDGYDLSAAESAEAALEDVEADLSDEQEEKAGIEADLRNAKDDIERLAEEKEEREADLDGAEREYERLEEALEAERAEKDRLESEIAEAESDAEAAVEEVRERAAGLPIPEDAALETLRDEEIPEARDELAGRREELGNRIGRLQTKEEQLSDLGNSGICPVCGAKHDGGHTADGRSVDEALSDTQSDIQELHEERERLSEQRDALSDLRSNVNDALAKREAVEDLEDDLEGVQDEIERLGGDVDEQATEIEEAEDALETAREELEAARDRVEELERDHDAIKERIAQLEDVKEPVEEASKKFDEIDDLGGDIEQYEQTIDHAREMRRTLLEDIDELEDEIDDIDDELEGVDVEELESNIDEYEGYRETAVEEKETAEAERETLRNDRSDKRAQLNAVEKQEARVETLTAQKEWGDAVVEDINDIIAAYEDVKAQLREENIDLLNAYTNEVFNDLYQNQSYAGVHIDRDYTVKLVTSDGAHMKPEVTSGGESTVVNLALRAGVYRLVAKRDSSGGDRLPPFILDEPTSFLDDDHVDELHSVIQAISEWNVPQILVVSHNDRLIQNADAALHVEKDPTEDASRVTPTHGGAETGGVAGDDD